MKKEKVFIVVTQIRSLRTKAPDSWQITEKVEFVDNLKNKHYTTASAVGDYINQKMIIGAAKGMGDYSQFETYIREKYPKQMEQLDSFFRPQPEPVLEVAEDSRVVTTEGDNIVVQ